MRRAVLPAVVSAWIACLAPSCSSTDVTLATLPSGDDAAPPPPPRCASSSDCPVGTYCDKAACGDPSGTCLLDQAECPDDEMPVCGCDGLTYFNHCLRQSNGVESETPGACPDFTCGGPSNTACPANTYCAQLGGTGSGHCSPMAEGNCWVLPPQCPAPTQGANLWDACQQPGPHCLGTCDALRLGGPYGRSFMCPP
ncbi:MAG TPA: Kazal-type serine protease inhibitor domain-containing protein [Polyangiaceae bacterium]